MSAFSAAAQDEDGDIISALRARVADLEAQLYAVGAGGVGKLEQPQTVTDCHQSQPQGEQEPVAWIENIGGGVSYNPYHEAARKLPDGVRFDLYTHPQPKREPLKDEQIIDIAHEVPVDEISVHEDTWHIRFVRAIERAHKIGGEA